jgi:hypothetical protein
MGEFLAVLCGLGSLGQLLRYGQYGKAEFQDCRYGETQVVIWNDSANVVRYMNGLVPTTPWLLDILALCKARIAALMREHPCLRPFKFLKIARKDPRFSRVHKLAYATLCTRKCLPALWGTEGQFWSPGLAGEVAALCRSSSIIFNLERVRCGKEPLYNIWEDYVELDDQTLAILL